MLETMCRNWLALAAALDRVVTKLVEGMRIEAMIARIVPRYIRQGAWHEVVPADRNNHQARGSRDCPTEGRRVLVCDGQGTR